MLLFYNDDYLNKQSRVVILEECLTTAKQIKDRKKRKLRSESIEYTIYSPKFGSNSGFNLIVYGGC